jgi:hypothetical protein
VGPLDGCWLSGAVEAGLAFNGVRIYSDGLAFVWVVIVTGEKGHPLFLVHKSCTRKLYRSSLKSMVGFKAYMSF